MGWRNNKTSCHLRWERIPPPADLPPASSSGSGIGTGPTTARNATNPPRRETARRSTGESTGSSSLLTVDSQLSTVASWHGHIASGLTVGNAGCHGTGAFCRESQVCDKGVVTTLYTQEWAHSVYRHQPERLVQPTIKQQVSAKLNILEITGNKSESQLLLLI